ncbi:MAG: hypothetical protein ABSB41_09440 [Anaerolineales bacterium]|jgi:hypothetical protein
MTDTNFDAMKTLYDLFKHLTTIDTGAIVILATFVTFFSGLKSYGSTTANWWVIACVIALILSLISCVFGMAGVTISMGIVGNRQFSQGIKDLSADVTGIFFAISLGVFVIGLLCLVAFVIVNLWV